MKTKPKFNWNKATEDERIAYTLKTVATVDAETLDRIEESITSKLVGIAGFRKIQAACKTRRKALAAI